MKMIIVAMCALAAVAIAAPVEEPKPVVQLVRSDIKQEPDGSYTVYVETDDGVIRQQTGELKDVPNEEGKTVKVIVVRGFYTIPGEEGQPQTINYVADENGYKAEGDAIPKEPEAAQKERR